MERPAECTSPPENLIKLCLPGKTAGTNCAVSQSTGPESSVCIVKGWVFNTLYTHTAYLQNRRKQLQPLTECSLGCLTELSCAVGAYLNPCYLYICIEKRNYSTVSFHMVTHLSADVAFFSCFSSLFLFYSTITLWFSPTALISLIYSSRQMFAEKTKY